MRILASLLLSLTLAACNRGATPKNDEAVRLGIVEYLGNKAQLNMAAMDVVLSSVQFNGKNADAMVSIRPKGGTAEQGMSMGYKLEQQGDKWVVTGRQESSGSQHGGTAMPSAPNPHGGDPAGKMPSPEDLPPAGKKK